MTNQTHPSVSIIIPAKNEETMVPRLLGSISRLNYPADRIEVILVDNGSTDSTIALAEAAGARVLSTPVGTIAHLRNTGVTQSTGEVLAFLDADMEVFPDWLASAVEKLADPGVGAVGGLLHIPQDTTWVEKTWFKHVSLRPRHGKVAWLGSGNLLMRRDLFQEVGGWDATLETCEDLDLCDRIKADYDLYHLETVAAVHHGGVKTLGELFRKELWRGKDTANRLAKVWRSPRELQSFLFPLLHGLALIGLIWALLSGSPLWPAFVVGGVLFPLLRTLMGLRAHRDPRDIPSFFVVWFAYYTARAMAPLLRRGAMKRRGPQSGPDQINPA